MSAQTLPVRAHGAHGARAHERKPVRAHDVRAFGMEVLRALSAARAVDVRIVERDGTDRRDAHLVLAAVVSGRFAAVRVTFDGRRRVSPSHGSSVVRIERERPVHGVRVPLDEPLRVLPSTSSDDVLVWLVLTLGSMPSEC